MAPCSGPKETANKKYIQTILFFRISFLNRSSGVHYSDGLSTVTNVFSIVKHVRNDCNKIEFHEKLTFSPSCETNPKQVTHEGSHYRISTTDREFVSCVVCLRMTQLDYDNSVHTRYTAISRKVVEKSARDNPERYCGWFLAHCFSKKFQTMAREAIDLCMRVLKV